MSALDLLALLVYTFGAYAFGALVVLSFRELGKRSWAGEPRPELASAAEPEVVGGAMLALGFVWFVANVALTLVHLGPRVTAWPLDVLAMWLAFLWPPLIMHVTVAEHEAGRAPDARPSRAWRRLLWPAYAGSLAAPLIATLVYAGVLDVGQRQLTLLMNLALALAFIAASVFSVAISMRHARKTASPRERVGNRAMNLMFAMMAVLFLLLPAIAFGMDENLAAVAGRSVEIAARSLPLAFLFVGAYFQSRFAFFDILLKRGLSLLVTIAALAGFFAFAAPLLRSFRGGAATLVTAILLVPLVLALPWIHSSIASALDRWWLGRRYTPVEAMKQFVATLRSATTEAELVERAGQALTAIFGAPAAVRLDDIDAPADGDSTGAAATAPANGADAQLKLRATAPPPVARDFSSAPTPALQRIPVITASGARAEILMGPRASEAPYFSEDVELLTSLAHVLASALDNVRLQARKQEQEQRARELSLAASRSELKALRAQINPHFLFNALNAIAGLIHRNPAGADRTIEQLADVFRYALRGSDSEWALLDEELEFVRAYLDVERARFSERLQVQLQMDEHARGARVPTMMLQTLVENAVKHGLSELRGPAIVGVDARVAEGRLVLAVTDNGPGFSPPRAATGRRAGGYGLANIRQRLAGYFGANGALTIDRDVERGLTIVAVSMPVVRSVPAAPRSEAIR